jgi:hypothetical protein
MDLVYKIYSVWLYQNQLKNDWLFFYNRKRDYTGELSCNAPYYMFGSSDFCASKQIYNMDNLLPDFLESSVNIMKVAAKSEGVSLIKNNDFITLSPCGESRVSYSGAFLPSDILETEGEYKGLKKNIYTPYDVIFNETKAGFNPHDFEVMGVWNTGSSQYSSYRIWEYREERKKSIRNSTINQILNEI